MLSKMANVLLDLHRGCRDQLVEDFPHWAMTLVQPAVSHHAWFWGRGGQIAGEIVAHSVLMGNLPLESMVNWERHKHLDFYAALNMTELNVVHNVTP